MVYEAYYDGNAVRTIENISIPKNYRVFVEVPNKELTEKESADIKNKLDALDAVCGLLTEDESKKYDEAIAQKLNFKERFEA